MREATASFSPEPGQGNARFQKQNPKQRDERAPATPDKRSRKR
jgi:hypothetical protein